MTHARTRTSLQRKRLTNLIRAAAPRHLRAVDLRHPGFASKESETRKGRDQAGCKLVGSEPRTKRHLEPGEVHRLVEERHAFVGGNEPAVGCEPFARGLDTARIVRIPEAG